VVGFVATAIVLAIAFAMPPKAPGYLLVIAQLLAIRALATKLQGDELAKHEATGGKIASRWRAAGVGAIVCVAILGVITAIVLGTN
jgi:hypothetical protein